MATVTGNAPGSNTPSGVVIFFDSSTALGMVALSNGTAAFSTPSLGSGTHSITAVYNGFMLGNYSFTMSVSAAASEVVSAVPPPSPLPSTIIVGADAGTSPQISLFNSDGTVKLRLFAFGQSFTGGVRVAQADVNGDGLFDIIAGAGPGANAEVKVFDGKTEAVLQDFLAWPAGTFTGGVFVEAGNFNGTPEIIVGAGSGANAEVKIFNAMTAKLLHDFFAWPAGTFSGGVRVAVGDINRDGTPDIICGAGPGAMPEIKVFDGKSLALIRDFLAFRSPFAGGVYVSAGDVNGDGRTDIICGAGQGGGPEVTVFDGNNGASLAAFFAFPSSFTGGVRVGYSSNFESRPGILTVAGPGGGPELNVIDGLSQQSLDAFFAFAPAFGGGVYVGGN